VAGDGEDDLAGLAVSLRVVRPLRLVRWVVDDADAGSVGLDGAVRVTLVNRSERRLLLRHLEEHGLVFVDPETGALAVLVHPCKCVKDALEPPGAVLALGAGQTREVELADFGCSGGPWPSPPPGRYRVEYRVLPAPTDVPPPDSSSPAVLVPRCRAELTSPLFWAGAVTSAAVDVTLAEPAVERISVAP